MRAPPLALAAQQVWPEGPGHDHKDPAHHAGVAQGLEQVALLRTTETSVGEVDARGGLAVVAHFGRAGLSVVEVSEPAQPRLLGRLEVGAGSGTDVKLVPGEARALLATQGLCAGAERGGVALPGGTGCGVNLVGLEEPAAPRLLASLPFGGLGVHMLDVARIGGKAYAFLVGQGATYEVGIAALEGDALVPVALLATEAPHRYVHDVTVRPDPLTGRVLAYVAAWDQGVWVWGLSDPASPSLAGAWDPPEANNIHTVMPAYVEGRRLLVAGPEYLNTLHVLDASDLVAIREVGRWRFPDAKPEGSLRWSSHDFNLRDGRLYLAHYHGGLAVLGFASLAEAANPPLLAYALPVGEARGGWDAPMTWDAVPLGQGYVLAGDLALGLAVLRETRA